MFWSTKMLLTGIMLNCLNYIFPSTQPFPSLTAQDVQRCISDVLHDQLRVITHLHHNGALPQQERAILSNFIATSPAVPDSPKLFHTVASLSNELLLRRALLEFKAMLKQTHDAFLQQHNSFFSTLNIMKLKV